MITAVTLCKQQEYKCNNIQPNNYKKYTIPFSPNTPSFKGKSSVFGFGGLTALALGAFDAFKNDSGSMRQLDPWLMIGGIIAILVGLAGTAGKAESSS